MISSKQLKEKYFDFFKSKGHKLIPSASLIPQNDPTVLFTTAGMHPLVPYLKGERHPQGKRLVNAQKCVRTGDIEEVGDATHLTFFEMLGNWSLGDYFKSESIPWSWEFLTSKDWLHISPEKLFITVYKGDKEVQKDDESISIWKECFREAGIDAKEGERIFVLGKKDNWWGPAGKTGPCGPDTEIFYDTGSDACSKTCVPGCSCGKYFEIWNNVFMQYSKKEDGSFKALLQKNVDTGMGVERTVAVLNGFDSVFEVEPLVTIALHVAKLFSTLADKLSVGQIRSVRIIADHLRAATFILAEGVAPANVERGYVLRRLIRRSIRYGKELGINGIFTSKIAKTVIVEMEDIYPELKNKEKFIIKELDQEEEKFERAIAEGLKAAARVFSAKQPVAREKFVALMQQEDKTQILHGIFEKKRQNLPYNLEEFGITKEEFDAATISSEESFYLYQSFGLPIEMILELVREKDLFVSTTDFKNEVKKHQELSRTASAGQFKGGLADNSEQTAKYHTAAHLMLAGLRKILGGHVEQRGSNITSERIRFDFSHPQKVEQDQLKLVEDFVNKAISDNYCVEYEDMSVKDAKERGAVGVFDSKYGDNVKVYTIGDVSKEICGGPHAKKTGDLGHFKIIKEESSSAGVRRIKGILE